MFSGTLLGRFGADPELRSSQGGISVCTANVATDSGFGENKITTWTKIVAFGKNADNIEKYFKKGDSIFLTGEVVLEEWTNKNDEPQKTLKLLVSAWSFAGSNGKKEGSGRESRREEPRNGSRREESRRDDRGRDGERGGRGGGF